MAAKTARLLVIKKAGTAIAGVQEKGIAINAEPIDITSDDDGGYRTILSGAAGQQSIDVTVSGVQTIPTFRAAALAGVMLTDITVTYPDGKVISGDFWVNNYTENGGTKDAVKFSATLSSSGGWTYT